MDEEITIIDSNTRNEKIKNFFINNKKKLILTVSIILVMYNWVFIILKNLKKEPKLN